jgi:F-type H+-transporting ATPase subunit b
VDINMTLIGQVIAMAVFVWFCMKFVWPLIMGSIDQRQTEITTGLASAEKARADLASAKTEAEKMITAAREQARGIVEQANTRAGGIVEQAKTDSEELRTQVAKIAVAGAEKVLAREIDAKAHSDILSKLASEL